MTRSDEDYAREALEHLEMIERHVSDGSWEQQVLVDAVCLRLAAAIERASRLSDETRRHAFGASWAGIWATRNRIAHGYTTVDPVIVRATVEHDLGTFATALRGVLVAGA